MNETDARNALLVRAFESAPLSAHWGEEDRDWATRSAAQVEGEKASAQAFVARRAQLAVERLSRRLPAVAATLAAVAWKPWTGWLLAAAALVAGFVLDAVSANNRINILAPPILAILLWNLVVYLVLLGQSAWRAARPANRQRLDTRATLRPLQRLVARVVHGIPRSLLRPVADASAQAGANLDAKATASGTGHLATFVQQWLRVSGPLNTRRALAILHFGAAAFAIGALAGLYLRGLAFEYLAGWESTFLDAGTVGGLLHLILGPASALTGIALPDAAHLESIRLPGGAGENAAGWIHLYAVTILLFVVVPRAALGIAEGLRARRRAGDFPIVLTDNYFQNLQRRHRGDSARVRVLPYSFQLPAEGLAGLKLLMQEAFGDDTVVSVGATVVLGGEDRLGGFDDQPGAVALTVALFSLSATPETENHAAFVAALAHALPADAALVALVDESAFLKRFGTDTARLADRRATWRRILATRLDIDPVFVSLEAGDSSGEKREARREASRKLSEVLDENSGRMVQNARFRAGARASA
jgi:hypothetical protein